MAYKIGQLRRENDMSHYGENLLSDKNATWVYSQSQITVKDMNNKYLKSWRDRAFTLDENESYFSTDSFYYLNFDIQRVPAGTYKYSGDGDNETQDDIAFCNDLYYDIYLIKQRGTRDKPISLTELKENSQKITSIYIPYTKSQKGKLQEDAQEGEFVSVSLLFRPEKEGYRYILFKLSRNDCDIEYQRKTNEAENARGWLLQHYNSVEDHMESVNNIIRIRKVQQDESQVAYFNYYFLKDILEDEYAYQKIGYQGRPGDYIIVNNAIIRIGRSGIFELDQDQIVITSLRIPPTNIFLLDYAYNEQEISEQELLTSQEESEVSN